MPKVRFLNEHVTVEVPQGSVLRDVAQHAGIEIYRGMWKHLNCTGLGICGRCKIWVTSPETAVSRRSMQERFRRVQGIMRLACQVQILGDVAIRTRPIGPAHVELEAGQQPAEPASYETVAAERLMQAKEDEAKKAEMLAAKKKAAAEKKAAEEKARQEAEEKARQEAEEKARQEAEEKAKQEAEGGDAREAEAAEGGDSDEADTTPAESAAEPEAAGDDAPKEAPQDKS